ncbi:MAG: hypothetical protein QHH15_07980, partial [Candidatus Thermoplasmatota archaeon]|nr:hypothetical protein [Candidatus Thermoplasmatota archaeon]
ITKIKVQTKQEIKEIIVWDEKVKEIQKIKKGQHIKINNISIKENNGKKELHLNSNGLILKF